MPTRRITIGKHGTWTPDQARREAKRLAALVDQGIDPRQSALDAAAAREATVREAEDKARAENELAFDRMAALWLDNYEHERRRRPSSVRMAKLVVNHHLTPKLAGKPMPYIGRADLQPIIDGIPSQQRGIRRSVFAYASILFGWAHKRGDIAENPLASMAKPEAPKARDRVLSDDELAAVWRACVTLGDPFAPFFRLLILTGQRRSEVAAITWGEVDRATATWTIPADRAKNGVAHIVPLSDDVLAELDRLALAIQVKDRINDLDAKRWPKSGFVLTTTGRTPISGMTKAKAALDKAIGEARGSKEKPAPIDAWRIHDLRRTMATGFQRLGVRFEVTEAALNHVSGAKGGVAGIYQKHDWKDEKRSALEAWARHVAAILQPAEADNVVPIGAVKQAV